VCVCVSFLCELVVNCLYIFFKLSPLLSKKKSYKDFNSIFLRLIVANIDLYYCKLLKNRKTMFMAHFHHHLSDITYTIHMLRVTYILDDDVLPLYHHYLFTP